MEKRLAWFQQAKFGLFIHWGIYAEEGVEASWPIMAPDLSEAMFQNTKRISQVEYEQLPKSFNPVEFDADEWVRIAKEAGMRYIVFTAKHHDGFCMFDAPGTEYKITNTPYGKDICLELAQACERAGMPLGFYYSPPDMHHPGYRDTSKPAIKNWTGEPDRKEWGDYLDYMESHLRKLLSDYGKVSIIWFDGLSNHGKYEPERFHQLVYDLSPDTLINDRLGNGFDYVTPEQFIPKQGIPARTGKPAPGLDPGGDGFFRLVCTLFNIPLLRGWIRRQMQKYADGTLELTPVHQEPYPSPDRFQPWETCMTMGQTWAYNPNETVWKSPETLIQNLIQVVSRGGNYLLNVGPTDRGVFPPEAVERLKAIGNWMDENHAAIYGNTYTPVQGKAWGQATRKDDKVYLHIFEWPENGKLIVDPFPGTASEVCYSPGEVLAFTQQNGKLEVQLPEQEPGGPVPVLQVGIDPDQPGWSAYSPAEVLTVSPMQFIKNQAKSSAIINTVGNGLIALWSYWSRGPIPFAETSIDILITVAIISFLTAWILIGSTRGEIRKGNIALSDEESRKLKFPKSSALGALLVMLVCLIVYGGLLVGLIYLSNPAEISNWAYIIFKAFYTGGTGAVTAALAIWAVVHEKKRSE